MQRLHVCEIDDWRYFLLYSEIILVANTMVPAIGKVKYAKRRKEQDGENY